MKPRSAPAKITEPTAELWGGLLYVDDNELMATRFQVTQ